MKKLTLNIIAIIFLLIVILYSIFYYIDKKNYEKWKYDNEHYIEIFEKIIFENKYGNEKIMQAVNVLCGNKEKESDVKKCFIIITNGNTDNIEYHTACAIADWYYWNHKLPTKIELIMTNKEILTVVKHYIKTEKWMLPEEIKNENIPNNSF